MSATVIRLLLCDGVIDGEVCDAELHAPDGVHTVHQLRAVAYREHGWTTRRRDLCPGCTRDRR